MASLIHRYFKKEPRDVSYRDFLNFVAQRVEENQTLEYKPRGLLVRQDDSIISASDPHEIRGFAALAKVVAGFANSEGGLLILGVKEHEERSKGVVQRIIPNSVSPLPLTISREQIENNLLAKIQYPEDPVPRRKHRYSAASIINQK